MIVCAVLVPILLLLIGLGIFFYKRHCKGTVKKLPFFKTIAIDSKIIVVLEKDFLSNPAGIADTVNSVSVASMLFLNRCFMFMYGCHVFQQLFALTAKNVQQWPLNTCCCCVHDQLPSSSLCTNLKCAVSVFPLLPCRSLHGSTEGIICFLCCTYIIILCILCFSS